MVFPGSRWVRWRGESICSRPFGAAGAAGGFCRVIQLWTGQVWAGVCGAGLFAFSALVWDYARQAEVFALNNLLLTLVLLTATRFAEHRSIRNAFGCALVCGLALAHHHTAVFLVAPVAAWVLACLLRNPALRRRGLVAVLAGGSLGLLPYLYLPLASRFSSGLVWGESDSWRGFITHFFQAGTGYIPTLLGQWCAARLARVAARAIPGARVHWFDVIRMPLALLGGAAMWKRAREIARRSLAGVVVAALVAYLVVFQGLVNLSPTDPLLAGWWHEYGCCPIC